MKEKEKTEKETRAQEELAWSAAEHEHVEKDLRWYLAISAVGLFLLIVAIWQRNYFFGVFTVIAAAMLASYGARRPKVFKFQVNDEGVSIGKKFFAFERLESFSLRARPGALHELIVKQKTYVNPYLRIPADANTAARAKALLAAKLPEEEYQMSFLDLFADWFGL